MFQFFFKYPSPVFTKGRFVLLSAWPAWLLPMLIIATAGGLALLVRWRMRGAVPKLRSRRAWAVLGDPVGVCGTGSAATVAAGDDGRGAEFAAEHHRGGGG